MKYLLILFLLTSISVKGQSKKQFGYFRVCDTCTTSTALLNNIQGFSTAIPLIPLSYNFSGGTNGKTMLSVQIPQNKIPFDSLIIYVKKSQIKWLNDSTAVIYKQ